MRADYDVAVIGLGAMGSATSYHLAKRGASVIGLDRFAPPHTLGSTHGRTRIIREAYFEHPLYVPLVRRAYENWAALERDAGEQLLHITGGLMIGPSSGELVSGALRSALEHGIAHELLDAAALRHRFPVFHPDPHMVALLEERAGLLLPEQCIDACLRLAKSRGAELRLTEPARSWRVEGGAVVIETDVAAYRARRAVISAGAWLPELVPDVELPLRVERQMFHWFEPASDAPALRAERCPIALWEFEPGRLFATFPDLGDGVKIGIHHEGEETTPDDVRRTISAAEDEGVRALLERYMPAAAGDLRESRVCMYTNTPDDHFLIDSHPAHPEVVIASPCSGHGFKFASVIGEVLADLATGAPPAFDLTPFRLTSREGGREGRSPRPASMSREAHKE